MGLQTFATNSIGPGIIANLGTVDDAWILAGVVLASDTTTTIIGTGSDHMVEVEGKVLSSSIAIQLGDSSADGDNIVAIGRSGVVGSTSNTSSAIVLNGITPTLFNEGTISGVGGGVRFANGILGAVARLENDGTIDGRLGDGVSSVGLQGLILTNRGLISSVYQAVDFVGSSAQQFITNMGRIVGDVLLGDGDDTYNGAAGRISGLVIGHAGNDTLTTGAESDTVNGGAGNDIISGNGGDDKLNGNDDSDTLNGGAGNDQLDGGTGPDTLSGGAGNDTYIADLTDVIVEAAGAANGSADRILWTGLANQTFVIKANVENLTLTGAAATRGTGNALNNMITGNAAANILDGSAGNDTLSGLGGNDVLIGGLGRDTLTGGLNNDIFRYTAINQSTVALADIIRDFDDAGDDRIDISLLRGPAFVYRHNLAFTAAGQVRINDIAGADVIVEVNTGGTLAADFAIRLTGTTLASMSAGDFVL